MVIANDGQEGGGDCGWALSVMKHSFPTLMFELHISKEVHTHVHTEVKAVASFFRAH